MKLCSYLTAFLFFASIAGCGDEKNRTVTDDVDQQAIAEYEAELAKVTAQDIPAEGN
ncbi:hypothetical protein [Allorhodopirellula solitaria]|uniref:Secreted protein n=1 Tax=Allorhodopirellula solitaria TaxID=2527987 RepID=A0A5C5YKI5_9BACT|nr:hypothetical protein [Allorhodopirellula solitaria]TWT75394.1 hypothetical protein CA85_06850 [Allorhodopirellula solitaria]